MAEVVTTSELSREVIRCKHCHLNQFATRAGRCRKCRTLYKEIEPVIVATPPTPVPQGAIEIHDVRSATCAVMRTLRVVRGISQRDLAGLMHCPRTFVSKFENKKSSPTLDTLQRFANAVDLPIDGIVTMIEHVAKFGAQQGRA